MIRVSQSCQTLLDAIGSTDLLELPADVSPEFSNDTPRSARIFAKLEGSNPGGSVKDRIALAMIEAAERDGRLRAGDQVVEATSGNTGIGLALVCNIKGYPLRLYMPDHFSVERRQLLRSYGADLILTPSDGDMTGAREAALQFCKTHPNAFMPSQFENPENPKTHAEKTAREILDDLPSGIRLAALVVGVGTAGVVMGLARGLKPYFPEMNVIAVEPLLSPVLSGGTPGLHAIHGIGAGFVPPLLDRSRVDEVLCVSDEDAFETAETLARRHGLLVGISSGANVFAARKVAARFSSDAAILTLFCDQGQRYFSLKKQSLEDLKNKNRLIHDRG